MHGTVGKEHVGAAAVKTVDGIVVMTVDGTAAGFRARGDVVAADEEKVPFVRPAGERLGSVGSLTVAANPKFGPAGVLGKEHGAGGAVLNLRDAALEVRVHNSRMGRVSHRLHQSGT